MSAKELKPRRINSTLSFMLFILVTTPYLEMLWALHNGMTITPILYQIIMPLFVVVALKLVYNFVKMAKYDRRGLVVYLVLLLLYAAVATGIICQGRS